MTLRGTMALAAVGALLLAGCGPEGTARRASLPPFCQEALAQVDSFLASVPEHSGGERYGGTAVVGTIGEIADGMNALVSADYGASQHQSFVNLMTLIQYDEELRPVPYLAESWEVSEDHTELTFHLRDDVRWHDGRRTTAHDVEFTYLRATDPRTGFPNQTFWTFYEEGAAGVEVVDSFTVRFRMEPHAEFMDPWRTVSIMPRHLLEDVPPEELKQHPFGSVCPVGNGPFVFEEHRQDDRWSFRANPAFPEGLGGRPYLDRYVYRIIPEQTTLLTELLTENIDVYLAARPDQAGRIQEAEHLDFRHFPFRQYTFVGWNLRRAQLADSRVRRAVTMAVDRQMIVDATLQGYGVVAHTGVPPFHWAYSPEIGEDLVHDPDGARELLEEAGWIDRSGDGIRENEDGQRLAVGIRYNQGNQQRQDIAEIMQSQLREVGIEVRPRVVEWATLVNQLIDPTGRDFEGVVMAWVVEFKLDDTDLFHSDRIDGPYGWAGLQDPRVDELLDTLPLIVDRDEAIPLWREYQELLVELQPYTYLYFPERLEGVNRRLRNVTMDVRGEWVNLKEWWIPSDRRRYGGGVAEP